jgi:hypothetical protein
MATNYDERIKGLETQAGNIRERLAKIEGRLDTPSKSPNTILITVLSIVGVGIIWYLGWIGVQVVDHGKKLTAIVGMLAPQTILGSLSSAVSATPTDAKNQLAQAATAIRQLQKAKVRLPESAASEAASDVNKLIDTHQDLPETWSVVGDFITYRSQMLRGWQDAAVPPCDSQFHKFKITEPIKKGETESTITHGPVEVHDCKIVLDSPDTVSNLSMDLSLADIVFRHCAIYYNGGPIVLTPIPIVPNTAPKLVGRVSFEDCLFVVSLPNIPPSNGIEFAKALLASPNGTLTFNRPS